MYDININQDINSNNKIKLRTLSPIIILNCFCPFIFNYYIYFFKLSLYFRAVSNYKFLCYNSYLRSSTGLEPCFFTAF